EIARSLSAALTVEAVAQQALRHALQSARADRGHVEHALGDQEVRVVASVGEGGPPRGATLPYPGTLTEGVIESRAARGAGARDGGGGGAPLLDDGAVLGAIVLHRAPGRTAFAAEDLAQAMALATLVSAALRRVVLGEERDRQRQAAETAVRARDEVLAIV